MNSQRDPMSIQVTADALVVLRANEALAGPFGVVDPYAACFVTDAGKRMAGLAESVDPSYAPFNLVRYRYFTEQIREAASRYHQLLILGAGYDTRSISMPEFGGGSVEVFEVDYPDKLACKQHVLSQAGVAAPSYIKQVPADLAQPDLLRRLCAMGFQKSVPVLVLMEGLVYFLASETTAHLLDPKTLELAAGSSVIFDYWPNNRINRLNQRIEEKLGHPLFCPFPYPDTPADLQRTLAGLGYRNVVIRDLDALAENIQRGPREVVCPNDWFIAKSEYGTKKQA